MQNGDSAETLRKLLAEASLAAAKAHLPDECDDDEDNDEVDDGLSGSDEPYASSNSNNAESEVDAEEEDKTLRQADSDEACPSSPSSSASFSFDAGLCSSLPSKTKSMGSSSHGHHVNIHPGQIVLEALQKLESESGDESTEGDELWIGLLAETDRARVTAAVPRAAIPLVRYLAADVLAAQAQIKRLRSRIRRLGQRVSGCPRP